MNLFTDQVLRHILALLRKLFVDESNDVLVKKDRARAFINSGKININFRGECAPIIYNFKSHFSRCSGCLSF